MYIQLNDILKLAKLKNEKSAHIVFLEIKQLPGRSKEPLNLRRTRTEKATGEFNFNTCKITNQVNKNKIFFNLKGLKNGIFSVCAPCTLFSPQLQSTCYYMLKRYVKIWHVRLGGANNMHPPSWEEQTEMIQKTCVKGNEEVC